MAAADIKRQHEEIKARFDVRPFQIINNKVHCKHRKAVQHDNDINDVRW